MQKWKEWEEERQIKNQKVYAVLKQLSANELMELVLQTVDHFSGTADFLLFQTARGEPLFELANGVMSVFIAQAPADQAISLEKALVIAEGGEIVLEKAIYFSNNGDYSTAVHLYLIVLANYLPLLKKCEDLDDVVVFLIDRCINGIHNAVLQIAKLKNATDEKRAVFGLIRREALKRIYDHWIDWRADLLQSSVCLCEDKQVRCQLEQTVEQIIAALPDNHFYQQYVGTQLMGIIYSIVQAFDTPLSVQSFVLNNVRYDFFREIALKKALEKENYMLVINLSNAERWKPYLYYAYKGLGDKKSQIALAEELVLANHVSFYPELKALFPPREWPEERELLLALLEEEKPPVYLEILIGEGQFDRVFAYCEIDPENILEAAPHLLSIDPMKTQNLLTLYLKRLATEPMNSLKEDIDRVNLFLSATMFFRASFGETAIADLLATIDEPEFIGKVQARIAQLEEGKEDFT